MSAHFPIFAKAVHKRLTELAQGELYVVDGLDLFESYLKAFPEGTNPLFRKQTEHDCSCCKNFIRNMGGLVAIVDGKKQSIWACEGVPEPYGTVANTMDEIVQQLPIKDIFRTKESRYGNEKNVEIDPAGNMLTWFHFHGTVDRKHHSIKPDEAKGIFRTSLDVLGRSLTELTVNAVNEVVDLIESNALYRGQEHLPAVKAFQALQAGYLMAQDRELFTWANAHKPGTRFRNTAIGTLVEDLSSGMDTEKAVRMFESKVAPTNYKRSTALITPKMIDQALDKLRELGLAQAIERRFARFSDISINDVLFVDNAVVAEFKDGLKNMLMEGLAPRPKKLGTTEAISINRFMETILPSAYKLELAVENRHLPNFVSLTAPIWPSTGRLFKWRNDFAWSYDGEVADSIKERVKRAGGNTGAPLRVSLSWSNYDDLDLHANCPDGHIFYAYKLLILDVDMNAMRGTTREPVENLSWQNPKNGHYRITVDQFNRRETTNVGFTLEIECQGVIQQFSCPVSPSGNMPAISFDIQKGTLQNLQILNKQIVGGVIPTTKWGVTTGGFVPVTTLMTSPNHWEGADFMGNKHWFFMLKDCLNPLPVRGIYNEFLRGDLEPHRKVFEVLGSKTKCQPTPDQLSGLGFSSSRGDEIMVRATMPGSVRTFNIVF